jgi:glutamate synthase domain-containing protein 3
MMAVFDAVDYDQHSLLEALKASPDQEIEVLNLNGHRYLGCGWKNSKRLVLRGTAGNNLGAFADGPTILLYGNGQEGVGNTMSDGEIVVYGRVGDIAGYGMRGGGLYIRDDAGYRLGIHMKAYQDKRPVIVVGGQAGAFVGEYMAGGTIIVLGVNGSNRSLIGPYCGTGMYEGEIYMRGEVPRRHLAENTKTEVLHGEKDLQSILPYLMRFAAHFSYDIDLILAEPFIRLTAVDKRIFSHMYTGFTG